MTRAVIRGADWGPIAALISSIRNGGSRVCQIGM